MIAVKLQLPILYFRCHYWTIVKIAGSEYLITHLYFSLYTCLPNESNGTVKSSQWGNYNSPTSWPEVHHLEWRQTHRKYIVPQCLGYSTSTRLLHGYVIHLRFIESYVLQNIKYPRVKCTWTTANRILLLPCYSCPDSWFAFSVTESTWKRGAICLYQSSV